MKKYVEKTVERKTKVVRMIQGGFSPKTSENQSGLVAPLIEEESNNSNCSKIFIIHRLFL